MSERATAAGSSSASRLRRQSAAERKRERFFAISPLDARTSATSQFRGGVLCAATVVVVASDGSGAWW